MSTGSNSHTKQFMPSRYLVMIVFSWLGFQKVYTKMSNLNKRLRFSICPDYLIGQKTFKLSFSTIIASNCL